MSLMFRTRTHNRTCPGSARILARSPWLLYDFYHQNAISRRPKIVQSPLNRNFRALNTSELLNSAIHLCNIYAIMNIDGWF
jgi:hypothetical protein